MVEGSVREERNREIKGEREEEEEREGARRKRKLLYSETSL